MKSKTIFKTLALAMLMPAMLLTTACSSEDDSIINNEEINTDKKGYEIPVTIKVTRQGGATTRATYNEGTKKLDFSVGDQLNVAGKHDIAGAFSGILEWQSGDTFSGTITTTNPYSGTALALLSETPGVEAVLLPAGYENTGFFYFANGYAGFYETKPFATSKATAIEQFSYEHAKGYNDGFALEPLLGIANFTITGLTANANVAVLFDSDGQTIEGNVETDDSGTATFAIGIFDGKNFDDCELKLEGKVRDVPLPNKVVEAGHIYNITRRAVTDLSMVDCAGTARESRWTANCYMVQKAGDYKLPLVYGNALVAAKDGSGNIVWSWHIWVTKQTFAASTLTTVNTGSHTYTLTPVNLGWVGDAVSQGYNIYYQWGRKDAFIPGTGTGNTNHTVYDINGTQLTSPITYSTTSVGIDGNIKNPTTFYDIDDKPCNVSYYNLWDAQQTSGGNNIKTATKKTVYDPCPAGFCVPTGNLYYYIKNGGVSSEWDETNKGRSLTSVTPNVFFPFSGYRKYSSGYLGNVGSYGYCWSASGDSSRSSNARYLLFRSGSWGWSSSGRSYGYAVRAVAEE